MNRTPDYKLLFYKKHLTLKALAKDRLSNVLELIRQLLTLLVGYLYSNVATGGIAESAFHHRNKTQRKIREIIITTPQIFLSQWRIMVLNESSIFHVFTFLSQLRLYLVLLIPCDICRRLVDLLHKMKQFSEIEWLSFPRSYIVGGRDRTRSVTFLFKAISCKGEMEDMLLL